MEFSLSFVLSGSANRSRANLATFRSDCKYEIEYEYDLRISKQPRSQSSRSSLLLTSREGCHVNDIGVTGDNLKPATRN